MIHQKKIQILKKIGYLKNDYLILMVCIIFFVLSINKISFNSKLYNDNNVKFILPKQAFQATNNGYIFVDVRTSREYQIKRIKDAYSFPYSERNKWKYRIQNKIPKNAQLIIYCDSSICKLSNIAHEYLKNLGYNKIYILRGGIKQWEKNGYPTQS